MRVYVVRLTDAMPLTASVKQGYNLLEKRARGR